ncbi:hypothetical protein QBC37DRAFT_425866 [Rhypophila decipiens]|uniref:Vacuolar ATPase assembly protein VMA22 n=1 Tax=Rhypophila decipiens TaxID=261697 RepID=A0AAN7B5S9_9PEZI|nr:hypothetical protein QBC37DRAFT_425866 [Rhypophila decipiens]
MTAPNPDTTTTSTAALGSTIDTLLQRYLILLDEYTTLRSKLNQLQSGIYQNIARANFSAERGIRYGQDHYDERMQALRRVVIQSAGEETAGGDDDASEGTKNGNGNVSGSFSVKVVKKGGEEDAKVGEEEKEKPASKEEDEGAAKGDLDTPPPPPPKESSVLASSVPPHTAAQEKDQQPPAKAKQDSSSSSPGEKEDTPNSQSEKKKSPKSTDPLRWFGFFTPQPLRQAQSQAFKAVDEILPRLVTVNMAMAEVELEVRRARKKRTKAAAATTAH